jgi:hypothetical protein
MSMASVRLYACFAAAALALSAAPAHAQFQPRSMGEPVIGERFIIEGAIGFWNSGADMFVTSDGSGALQGIIGSRIDFKNDLGLTDQTFPEFHAVLKGGGHKLRFQYIPINFTQEGILERTIVFNGQAYPLGIATNSQLKWNAFRFGYEYDFIRLSRGFGGFILDAKYTEIEASLRNPATFEYVRARAPIPAIGGIARVYVVPNISATFEMTGIEIPDVFDDYDGHYVDLDMYGTFNFTPNVGAQFGYRSFDVGVRWEETDGTFDLKGIYFGVVARY